MIRLVVAICRVAFRTKTGRRLSAIGGILAVIFVLIIKPLVVRTVERLADKIRTEETVISVAKRIEEAFNDLRSSPSEKPPVSGKDPPSSPTTSKHDKISSAPPSPASPDRLTPPRAKPRHKVARVIPALSCRVLIPAPLPFPQFVPCCPQEYILVDAGPDLAYAEGAGATCRRIK